MMMDNESYDDYFVPENNCPYSDIADLECFKGNGKHFVHLNIRSFLKNADNLKILLDDLHCKRRDIDIVMVCETFLNSSSLALAELDGYQSFHVTRGEKMGGGVSLFVRDGIKVNKVILSYTGECTECLLIECVIDGRLCAVGELYRILNTAVGQFLDDTKMILNKIWKYKSVIVGADQNLDLLKISQHSNMSAFYKLMLQSELVSTINKPTRVTHSTGTLIDNIYLRAKLNMKFESHILCDVMSDHFPCLLTIPAVEKCIDKIIELRSVNDDAILKINQRLLFTDWLPMHKMDVDNSTIFLHDCITSAIDAEAPKRQKKLSCKHIFRDPWMSVKLLKYNTKCRKLCAKANKSCKEADFVKYKNYRKTLNRLKLFEKSCFYGDLFSKIGKNSKMLWEVLNRLTKRVKNKTEITSVMTHGNKVVNKKEIVNVFNDHFVNVGKCTQESIKFKGGNFLANVPRSRKELKIKPITEGTLCRIVDEMAPKRSSGYDGISNFLLKRIISCIKAPFCELINKSISSGVFPDCMKKAKVIPLFKMGDNENPDNYRPISLLPVMLKVIEKHVYRNIVSFMEENNSIYPRQFGFRKQYSTVNAVQLLVSDILKSFDDNLTVASVFMDLRKAFDTISHEIICEKLECLGVWGQSLDWVYTYLSRRVQFCCINGMESSERPLEQDVPQGSLLGVLFFQLQINAMSKCLKFCNSILYADDTTIYVIGRNIQFMKSKLQSDMTAVSEWLSMNQLKLNVKKTKLVYFNKEGLSPHINVIMEGEEIECVRSFKFLGVDLDNQLNFCDHANAVHSQLLKTGFVISKIGSFLRTNELRILYFGHVHSIFTYGLTVWGTLISGKNLTVLYRQQKSLIRATCKLKISEHCMPWFKHLGVLTLHDQMEFECLLLMYKVNHDIAPIPVVNIFRKPMQIYNTRNHRMQNVRHNLKKLNDSFMNKAPILWQNVNNETKKKPSLCSFKRSVKKQFIEQFIHINSLFFSCSCINWLY